MRAGGWLGAGGLNVDYGSAVRGARGIQTEAAEGKKMDDTQLKLSQILQTVFPRANPPSPRTGEVFAPHPPYWGGILAADRDHDPPHPLPHLPFATALLRKRKRFEPFSIFVQWGIKLQLPPRRLTHPPMRPPRSAPTCSRIRFISTTLVPRPCLRAHLHPQVAIHLMSS